MVLCCVMTIFQEETSKRLEELVLSHANIGEKILKLHKVV